MQVEQDSIEGAGPILGQEKLPDSYDPTRFQGRKTSPKESPGFGLVLSDQHPEEEGEVEFGIPEGIVLKVAGLDFDPFGDAGPAYKLGRHFDDGRQVENHGLNVRVALGQGNAVGPVTPADVDDPGRAVCRDKRPQEVGHNRGSCPGRIIKGQLKVSDPARVRLILNVLGRPGAPPNGLIKPDPAPVEDPFPPDEVSHIEIRLLSQARQGHRTISVSVGAFFQEAEGNRGIEEPGQAGRVGSGPAGQLLRGHGPGAQGLENSQLGAGDENPGRPVVLEKFKDGPTVLVAHGLNFNKSRQGQLKLTCRGRRGIIGRQPNSGAGAWVSQAERAAAYAADRQNLTRVMPA